MKNLLFLILTILATGCGKSDTVNPASADELEQIRLVKNYVNQVGEFPISIYSSASIKLATATNRTVAINTNWLTFPDSQKFDIYKMDLFRIQYKSQSQEIEIIDIYLKN